MGNSDKILVCPKCGKFAKLIPRVELGKHFSEGMVYACSNYPDCDTYVGCHPGTDRPLGTMAGQSLRSVRVKAHRAFDWAWKSKRLSRTEAYGLMADILELPDRLSHIAMLDKDQCRKVIDAFNSFRPWKMPHR